MRLIFIINFLLLASQVSAAPDGRQLYVAHCSACHGDQGHGGVGVPLSLPSFLDSVDDRFLAVTIRQGRPGRVMPSFPKLSDAQIAAIVGYIRNWSNKPAPQYSPGPVKGDMKNGALLYAKHCSSCHGENGEGGTGTGVTFSRRRELPVIAPALNNRGFLAAASDELIRQTLQLGRDGTPMDSFLEKGLGKQEIDDVVSFVRSFAQDQGDGSKTAAANKDKIISLASPYSLEETVENLKDAIVSQNFVLIRTDRLEHGLVKEADENPKQVILHFCNFRFLYDALAVDPRVGMFLPCRVTVTETSAGVFVSTVNPEYMSDLFNNAELDEYCKQMRDVYSTILEDATL
ncbi:MAG: c-type cytochrome [Gammaproteobacteria bacterium]